MTPEPPLNSEENKLSEGIQPSFASAEEFKKSFKYDLKEMLPWDANFSAAEKEAGGHSGGKKHRKPIS